MIQTSWAFMDKDGKVMNIVAGSCCSDINEMNKLAVSFCGEGGFAYECDRYATQIGDTWRDHKFYKPDGTECKYIPTEKEEIDKLKLTMQIVINGLTGIIEELIPIENKNLNFSLDTYDSKLMDLYVYVYQEIFNNDEKCIPAIGNLKETILEIFNPEKNNS